MNNTLKKKSIVSTVVFLTLSLMFIHVGYADIGDRVNPYLVFTAGNNTIHIYSVEFIRKERYYPYAEFTELFWIGKTIHAGDTETFGPYDLIVANNPNSLEIDYRFPGQYLWKLPNDWNGVGLELSKTYTLVTAAGEPLTEPLPGDPPGDSAVSAEESVGGITAPIDKLSLLSPYIGLASTMIIATVATAIYIKRIKRRKDEQ